MKKYFLTVLCVVAFAVHIFCQNPITCLYRQNCYWDESTETYGNCIGKEETTLFEPDETQAKITETIQSVRTVYKITGREKSGKKGIRIFQAVDDSGEKYYFVFNSKINEVRVISKNSGKAMLSIYTQSKNSN